MLNKEVMQGYFKGFIPSIVAVIVFSALGWIKIGPDWNNLFAITLIAITIWTMAYVLTVAIWFFLFFLASCTLGLGALIGVGFVAYFLVQVAAYLLPAGIAVFPSNALQLFCIGIFFCVAAVVCHPNTELKVQSNKVGPAKEVEK